MAKVTYHVGVRKTTFFAILVLTVIFLTAVFLHRGYSSGKLPELDEERDPFFPKYSDKLILFAGLSLAYFVEAVLVRYNIATPYGAFVVMYAYLWGILVYHESKIRTASSVSHAFTRELMEVYVPISVFTIAFNVDVPTFRKTFTQILVIGIPACLLGGCLFGVISGYIINQAWLTKIGVALGVICAPTYPHAVTIILKQQNAKTKQISALLEGESLIEFFIADLSQKIVFGRIGGFIVHWYQIVAVALRVLIAGSATGYLFGYVGRALMRRMYTNKLSVLLVCFGIPLFTYNLSEVYISGCGSISVIIVGLMLSTEKSVQPKDVEKLLVDFWDMAGFFVEVVVLLKVSSLAAATVAPVMNWSDYAMVFIIYLMHSMMRLVSFLLFSPIISRLGYGMDLKTLLVCVWGGIQSSFTLLISAYFFKNNLKAEEASIFLFYVLGLYFLSVIINGSFTTIVLDFLGLRKISLARQMNMNNCLKHIFDKRERTIAILKTHRFLADSNWPRVIENTTIKHPYQLGMKLEEDNGYFLGHRFTWCGDCKRDILQEPMPKELKEMTREAKMRVLKAKKMSYSRHYEMGMVTKEGIRSLIHKIEHAMDSEGAEIDIEMMHNSLIAEDCCVRFLRKVATKYISKKQYRRPRTYWRRLCYNVVLKNRNFQKLMLCIVATDVIMMIIDMVYNPPSYDEPALAPRYDARAQYSFISFRIALANIYLIEFVMTILAYSWIRICGHGFKTYFTSFWHIQDFVVLLIVLAGITYDLLLVSFYHHDIMRPLVHQVLDILRCLRAIKLLKLFQVFYPDLINYLDNRLDSANARAFEIGRCYAIAEGEIIEMLDTMIDNKKIYSEMRHRIEKDRVTIYRLLGVIQKERPWVAITVKTTQAIRMILNGMKEAINQLKSSGWVDAYEYEKLTAALEELYKGVHSIKKVEPSPPNILFKEVSWMAEDHDIIEFLFENVQLRRFEPGEVVFKEGDVADGIYMVLTGVFELNYSPNDKTIDNLKQNGVIPVVDYIHHRNFEEKTLEHIVSGTCIGELSILTGRPYNCTITSDGHNQAYFISQSVLHRAMDLSPDPIGGLERRIWKEVGARIALPPLAAAAGYSSIAQDEVKYALERAFVPDLSNFKIFSVTESIEDIVLIEGVILDFHTKEMYTAPRHVPRTVQKLVLSQSSQLSLFTDVTTNLLIIPTKGADEYDVMLNAEEVCELVNVPSESKCLQHAVQDKRVQRRRRVRSRQKMEQISTLRSTSSSLATSIFSLDSASAGMPSTSTLHNGEEQEEKEKRAIEYTDKNAAFKRKASLFFM